MRTHTRYELQESTSIEEGPITDEVADSPHPGSLGSTAGPSRSISSESADPPVMPTQPPLKPKPPSPMETQTEEIDKSMEGTANPSDQWCDMISNQFFPLRFLHHHQLVNAWAQPNWSYPAMILEVAISDPSFPSWIRDHCRLGQRCDPCQLYFKTKYETKTPWIIAHSRIMRLKQNCVPVKQNKKYDYPPPQKIENSINPHSAIFFLCLPSPLWLISVEVNHTYSKTYPPQTYQIYVVNY